MLRRFLRRSDRARVLYWVLLVATALLYGAMALWTVPAITEAAGGRAPFDMRLTGYSVEEARAFLYALSDEGRALYSGPQQRIDNAFPALYGALLSVTIWRLFRSGAALPRAVLSAFPLLAMLFDYMENARVQGLLATDPQAIPDGAILAANTATLGKFALIAIAILTIVALSLVRLARKRREIPE